MLNRSPERRPLDPDDEELLLYHWGESPHADEVHRRLEASPELAARYAALCQLLTTVSELEVPSPGERYGARVWDEVRPRLRPRRSATRQSWRRRVRLARVVEGVGRVLAAPRLVMAGALAALLAVAYFVGRGSVPVSAPQPFAPAEQQRMLDVVVADHLERSERLLLELANAPLSGADLAAEREMADELLDDNRLYRQASRRSAQGRRLVIVLDELERLLLDLAHAPAGLGADELEALRERLEDVLFKVQISSRELRRDPALTL